MAKALLIKQKKAATQCAPNQKNILKGLGLRGVETFIYRADRRAVRGMLNKVQHLVEATLVEGVQGKASRGRGFGPRKTGTGFKLG